MNINPIKIRKDHSEALARIEDPMSWIFLITLVEAYEGMICL